MTIMTADIDILGFYDRYTELRPYVGDYYGKNPCEPKLLVIEESHGFDKNATVKQHLDPDTWYKGTSSTLGNDRWWINTCHNFRNRKMKEGFKGRSDRHEKEILKVINDFGFKSDNWLEVAKHIALYNFFLRPAEEAGGSICVRPIDRTYANAALRFHIETLKPTALLFISKKAFENVDWTGIELKRIGTQHACCSWWNRASKRNGGKTGRQVLAEFVKELFQQ